jgi:hypothetical protein
MNPRRFIANSAPAVLNPSVGIFSAQVQAAECPLRSVADLGALNQKVCLTPENGHGALQPPCPHCADIAAKVENRTTLKISRKLIFRLLCCCVAFQSHYGGR